MARSSGCGARGSTCCSGAIIGAMAASRGLRPRSRDRGACGRAEDVCGAEQRAHQPQRSAVPQHRGPPPGRGGDRAAAIARPRGLRRVGGAARAGSPRRRADLLAGQGRRRAVQPQDEPPGDAGRPRALVTALVAFRDRADADLAALVHEDFASCIEGYEQRKQKAGALDFLDLLMRARNLVRENADVRREFQERFRFILVDEFQDTDPLQAELLLDLASDRARPRPSRARCSSSAIRSSPSTASGARTSVSTTPSASSSSMPAPPGQAAHVVSERARHSACVNAAFSRIWSETKSRCRPTTSSSCPTATDHAGQPAVVALPVPRPYGRRQVTLANWPRRCPRRPASSSAG